MILINKYRRLKDLKAFITVIGIILFHSQVDAQIIQPCIDSMRINKYFQCYAPFMPVCGCNNVTYRNDCESYNVYGVNIINSVGVCKNDMFYLDFYPNPCTENLNISVEFYEQGNL